MKEERQNEQNEYQYKNRYGEYADAGQNRNKRNCEDSGKKV